MLVLAQQAEQRLAELRDAPVGELRIAAPVGFSGRPIIQALMPLLQAHNGLRLKLFFHDEQIDLIEQRIDLAIRLGRLEDSSLVARHIGDSRMLLCAAPAYLARKAPILLPDDLPGHDWLTLNQESPQTPLVLRGPQDEVRMLRLDSRVGCNNILSLRQFTLAGMGISLQPEQEIREELASGRLQVLLPHWQAPSFGVYLVTPRRDAQPAKVRYALDALRQHLLAG